MSKMLSKAYWWFLRKIEEPLKGIFILIGVFTVINFSFGVFIEYVNYKYQNAKITIHNVEASSGDEGENKPTGIRDSREVTKIEEPDERRAENPVINSNQGLEEKIREFFPEDYAMAIAISKCESGLNPSKASKVDVLTDGRAFSYGLMQINLTVSNIDGVPCNEAFEGRNGKAKVINEQLYDKCVALATNPIKNLETARAKYDGGGWNHWKSCFNKVSKNF